jgi:hypothetical protein
MSARPKTRGSVEDGAQQCGTGAMSGAGAAAYRTNADSSACVPTSSTPSSPHSSAAARQPPPPPTTTSTSGIGGARSSSAAAHASAAASTAASAGEAAAAVSGGPFGGVVAATGSCRAQSRTWPPPSDSGACAPAQQTPAADVRRLRTWPGRDCVSASEGGAAVVRLSESTAGLQQCCHLRAPTSTCAVRSIACTYQVVGKRRFRIRRVGGDDECRRVWARAPGVRRRHI